VKKKRYDIRRKGAGDSAAGANKSNEIYLGKQLCEVGTWNLVGGYQGFWGYRGVSRNI